MLRIRVDFNERELLTPGVETTVIFAEDLDFPATELKVGLRMILFCSDFETEAFLNTARVTSGSLTTFPELLSVYSDQ
jgi:hypothetical protein